MLKLQPSARIARYVAREVVFHGALILVSLMALMVAQGVIARLDDLRSAGASNAEALRVIVSVIVSVSVDVVPLALLWGVILAIARMGNDRELLGMRAVGQGPGAIVAGVLGVALVASVVAGSFATWFDNAVRRDALQVLQVAPARMAYIQPGRFSRVGERVFWIDERDEQGRLSGIFVRDVRNDQRELAIFAETGWIRFEESARSVAVELHDGAVLIETEKPGVTQTVRFATLTYRLDVAGYLEHAGTAERPKQLRFADLVAVNRGTSELGKMVEARRGPYRSELLRRLGNWIHPLLLAAVVLPIAFRAGTRARFATLALAALVSAGYYASVLFGLRLAETDGFLAASGFWWILAAWAGLAAFGLLRLRRGFY